MNIAREAGVIKLSHSDCVWEVIFILKHLEALVEVGSTDVEIGATALSAGLNSFTCKVGMTESNPMLNCSRLVERITAGAQARVRRQHHANGCVC